MQPQLQLQVPESRDGRTLTALGSPWASGTAAEAAASLRPGEGPRAAAESLLASEGRAAVNTVGLSPALLLPQGPPKGAFLPAVLGQKVAQPFSVSYIPWDLSQNN